MNKFTVTYVIEAEGIQWQFFNCLADDAAHAVEQCVDAYPDCAVLWVMESMTWSLWSNSMTEQGRNNAKGET